jgi:hypothetical protein
MIVSNCNYVMHVMMNQRKFINKMTLHVFLLHKTCIHCSYSYFAIYVFEKFINNNENELCKIHDMTSYDLYAKYEFISFKIISFPTRCRYIQVVNSKGDHAKWKLEMEHIEPQLRISMVYMLPTFLYFELWIACFIQCLMINKSRYN